MLLFFYAYESLFLSLFFSLLASYLPFLFLPVFCSIPFCFFLFLSIPFSFFLFLSLSYYSFLILQPSCRSGTRSISSDPGSLSSFPSETLEWKTDIGQILQRKQDVLYLKTGEWAIHLVFSHFVSRRISQLKYVLDISKIFFSISLSRSI